MRLLCGIDRVCGGEQAGPEVERVCGVEVSRANVSRMEGGGE